MTAASASLQFSVSAASRHSDDSQRAVTPSHTSTQTLTAHFYPHPRLTPFHPSFLTSRPTTTHACPPHPTSPHLTPPPQPPIHRPAHPPDGRPLRGPTDPPHPPSCPSSSSTAQHTGQPQHNATSRHPPLPAPHETTPPPSPPRHNHAARVSSHLRNPAAIWWRRRPTATSPAALLLCGACVVDRSSLCTLAVGPLVTHPWSAPLSAP